MYQLKNAKRYSSGQKAQTENAQQAEKKPDPIRKSVWSRDINWGHVLTIAGGIFVLSGLITGAILLFGHVPLGPAKPKATLKAVLPSLSPTLPADIHIAPTDKTDPVKLKFTTSIYEGDTKVSAYTRPQPICFPNADDYTTLPGITTFRGNNYRDMSGYGVAAVTQETLTKIWENRTGSVKRSDGKNIWNGSGWTGQPLIVKWPDDIKKIMNIHPSKKNDPGLIEVIYPCLDGHIYFLDLRDGTETRMPIVTGVAHKATSSLYPSGIPMLFVGQGDTLPTGTPNGEMKYHIYSLIDQKLLTTFGQTEDISYRKSWNAFDASPLISAETDTLIEPGESGILYTIKLNTQFDREKGTLTVSPDKPVKFTYTSPSYKDGGKASSKTRWYGWETSPVIWRNYLIAGDNGGTMMCIDLNTMKLVWAGDCTDDTNSSPVLEESIPDGTAYIYSANSIEAENYPKVKCTIRKMDIRNGESVWKKTFDCYTADGTEGGCEGTPILGKGDIRNLIIYPLARIPGKKDGTLVALDKATGDKVWEVHTGNYLWSSPVTFYTPSGKSYIAAFDTATGDTTKGNIYLIEGASGKLIHKYTFKDYSPEEYDQDHTGAAFEATAAVYDDMLVIGSRGYRIYAFKIK